MSFNDRVFTKPTTFKNATFHVAPTFHNCRLYQDTEFLGARFLDTHRNHAHRAYRILKLAMKEIQADIEQQMFHALEHKALSHLPETPLSIKVISYLYELASNYGQSMLRPILWLVGVTALFTANYSIDLDLNWTEALTFSLEQIVKPFSVLMPGYEGRIDPELAKSIKTLGIGLKVAAAVQSLVSLTFVTLFALAIRRRFKMQTA